ncbi:MAG: hypothetical protein WC758_07560 [Candidatus Woesearchaeota archaeon]|jgi:hypothetical protein
MSWDKNTRNCSELDKTIELLKELKIPYKVKVLGTVIGHGNNDDYALSDKHEIRRLDYNDKVILEQMRRNDDCDFDDLIISLKFEKSKVPKKWKIEVRN